MSEEQGEQPEVVPAPAEAPELTAHQARKLAAIEAAQQAARASPRTKAGYAKKPAPIDPATGEPIKRGRGRPAGVRTKGEIEAQLEAEVAQLRAMLAQAEKNAARVTPEETLAARGITINSVVAAPVVDPEPMQEPESITINFVEDGFTALGKMWYRGQELTVTRGTEEWDLIHDKHGNSWINYDEFEQERKFGRRIFRHGKWRGAGYDFEDENLDANDRETLRRVSASLSNDNPGKRALGADSSGRRALG